jgi:hypothetical protein
MIRHSSGIAPFRHLIALALALALALAAPLLAVMPPAAAGSLTLMNTTDLVAYQGSAPAPFFPGPNPYVAQQAIGSEFTTPELTVSATLLTNGSTQLTFDFETAFSGYETINGVTIQAADVFLQPISGGPLFGISLGDQAQNGGVQAGFYQVQSAATSQSIWAARPSFYYGGAIATSAQYLPGQAGYSAAPIDTVITAGTLLSHAAVAMTAASLGWYNIDASVVLTPQQSALFAAGFDVLWGAGDCGNGAFETEVPSIPVMEPASFLLLVTGIAGSIYAKRKKGFFLKKEAKTFAGLSRTRH